MNPIINIQQRRNPHDGEMECALICGRWSDCEWRNGVAPTPPCPGQGRFRLVEENHEEPMIRYLARDSDGYERCYQDERQANSDAAELDGGEVVKVEIREV
jgi:hypothetical protein